MQHFVGYISRHFVKSGSNTPRKLLERAWKMSMKTLTQSCTPWIRSFAILQHTSKVTFAQSRNSIVKIKRRLSIRVYLVTSNTVSQPPRNLSLAYSVTLPQKAVRKHLVDSLWKTCYNLLIGLEQLAILRFHVRIGHQILLFQRTWIA